MRSSRVTGQRSDARVLWLARRGHEAVHDRGWAFIAADAGQRGTFGSGGCLKTNHPGGMEQTRGGGEAGRGRLTPAPLLQPGGPCNE